jgi:hypothetical protein
MAVLDFGKNPDMRSSENRANSVGPHSTFNGAPNEPLIQSKPLQTAMTA